MSRGKLFATVGAVAALAAGIAAPASQACHGGSSHHHHYSGATRSDHSGTGCDHNGDSGGTDGGGGSAT